MGKTVEMAGGGGDIYSRSSGKFGHMVQLSDHKSSVIGFFYSVVRFWSN